MNLEGLGAMQLQTLVLQTGLPVAACDKEGRMTLLSPALQRLLEMPFEIVEESELAKHFRLFNHDGSSALRPEDVPLMRARRGEIVTDALITTRTKRGCLLYLRCNAAPVRDSDGNILGAIVLAQDVTAEHVALQQHEELRERLVTTVNHELRTPLTKLGGYVELLHDQRDEFPEAARRAVDAVMQAAQDVQSLLTTVADLVDLDGHTNLRKTYCDVTELLREVADQASAGLATRQLTLSSDLETTEAPTAVIDPLRLRRAVLELLDNAVQYAPTGSEVMLELGVDAHSVTVTVADQGSGIPAPDRARLVHPFERGDHPHQPVNSKGMGLAIANTVATAHGGRLTLETHQPTGLCAKLTIPRDRARIPSSN